MNRYITEINQDRDSTFALRLHSAFLLDTSTVRTVPLRVSLQGEISSHIIATFFKFMYPPSDPAANGLKEALNTIQNIVLCHLLAININMEFIPNF